MWTYCTGQGKRTHEQTNKVIDINKHTKKKEHYYFDTQILFTWAAALSRLQDYKRYHKRKYNGNINFLQAAVLFEACNNLVSATFKQMFILNR